MNIFKDNILGVDYKFEIITSAKELSAKLKKTYKSMKIDFEQFNTSTDGSDVEKNPPVEIYEYQNFFLLEKTDGNVILLDGFRRLLWYNAPETPIMVRTYKQSDLSSAQILMLLVNLNHFKFFSDSSYQERGFGLLLKTVFDIDITKFRSAFDAYLSSNETHNSYTSGMFADEGTSKIDTIKKRILGAHFVDDMKFLSTLKKEGCMVNSFFGALLYQKRTAKDGVFDIDGFLKLHKADTVLAALIEKYKKAGTNTSVKSQEAVNQIQETYNKFLTILDGGVVEKTYAEKVQECKEIREKLNKDKEWSKLTGNSNCYDIERLMAAKLKDIQFKCLVMPEPDKNSSYSSTNVPLRYGLNELPKFIGKETPRFMREEMVFGFKDEETGASWTIKHNYGGYNSYGKKYTYVSMDYNAKVSSKYDVTHTSRYDIELWVNIPKSELKK